jgi:hypothetical protein
MKLCGYSQTIKQLKAAILVSRYKAAALANKGLFTVYFNVGKLITERENRANGAAKYGIIVGRSVVLIAGLKGLQATNIKNSGLFLVLGTPFFNWSVAA